MSGHYATLLRGTVETFLPTHQVYITDWADARMVPLAEGRFDLDDYIDYLIDDVPRASGRTCTSWRSASRPCRSSRPSPAWRPRTTRCTPRSMILMGGPIDTRRSPTAVNQLAEERGIDWFEPQLHHQGAARHPGFWRDVYPGFLQLSGFMAMNIDRHLTAHWDMFNHLVEGDGDSAEKHRDFYDEYLAVMDLTAEFYLQTVDKVFVAPRAAEGRDDAPRTSRST